MRFPRLLAAAVVVASLGRTASAQTADTTRVTVTGTVYDSVAGRPLAAATVQIASRANTATGPTMTTFTDSTGAFRFTGVPRGEYIATFFHERLDSLGIVAAVRSFRFESDATIHFAIPGTRTVRTALCGPSAKSDSSAAIVGQLTAVDARTPVANAVVSAQWFELSFGSKGLVRSTPTVRAATDASGRFLLCGLPGDAGVDLWATAGHAATGTIHVALEPFAVVAASLAVDPSDSAGRDSAGARHGSAEVSGVVRLPGGEPMPDARVRLREGDRETVTDQTGHYSLTGLPAGTFSLEARAIGFVPVSRPVTLSASQPLAYDIRFDSAARILKTVEVHGKVIFDRAREEFDKARKRGFGYFITPEQVERRYAFDASQLLETAPGVRVGYGGFGRGSIVTVRGCVPTFVIDGMRFEQDSSLDNLVSAQDVLGIAVYRDASEAPAEYQSLHGCGTIVVWTKRR